MRARSNEEFYEPCENNDNIHIVPSVFEVGLVVDIHATVYALHQSFYDIQDGEDVIDRINEPKSVRIPGIEFVCLEMVVKSKCEIICNDGERHNCFEYLAIYLVHFRTIGGLGCPR